MVHFQIIDNKSKIWIDVIKYAKKCSWKAGPYLAHLMQNNVFSDWERVIVGLYENEIASYCTLTKKDSIPEIEYSPFIGFVFVGEQFRGKRVSERMIQFALSYARSIRFRKVYLISGEIGLYEKYGFEKIEDRRDISRNSIEQIFQIQLTD